ncbi:hypothetical protein C8R44DRAFT_858088, partial [Mycena epipterygia]
MATPETPTTMPEPRSATPVTMTGPRPPTPATPSEPSGFTFPRPPSPSKNPELKPNAHPYPIKTTSTGILSRSNSVSSSPATRHHYVPSSPAAASPAKEGRRGEYRGHRYSRSLSASDDMYLPSSGSAGNLAGNGSGSGGGGGGGGVQGPRALPVPPGVSNNSIASRNAAAAAAAGPGVAPKRWTPEQLAAHLGSAVSREAGEWAARRGVGGRAFMRMSEEELAEMGAPPALRPAARALRQEVLQGQLESSSPISSASSGSESEFPFAQRVSSTRMSPTRMSPSPTRFTSSSPTRFASPSPSPTRMHHLQEQDGENEAGEDEDDDGTPSRRAPHQTAHIAASASPFTSPFRQFANEDE